MLQDGAGVVQGVHGVDDCVGDGEEGGEGRIFLVPLPPPPPPPLNPLTTHTGQVGLDVLPELSGQRLII